MTGTNEDDVAAVVLTLEAIGRTGAREADLGYDPEIPDRWWAAARYEGRRVTCDNQPDPVSAVLGLYGILAAGGLCTTCERTVALASPSGLAIGARMRDGIYETAQPPPDVPAETFCVRRLESAGWTGCGRTP